VEPDTLKGKDYLSNFKNKKYLNRETCFSETGIILRLLRYIMFGEIKIGDRYHENY